MRAAVEAHLGSQQVTRVVYGAIIGLTLVVAVQDHPPPPAVMAAWLGLTGVTVGLAEVYSEVIGIETSERHRVTRQQVAHVLGHAWGVLLGVAFPGLFFLLAAVDLLSLDTAFAVAKYSGLALIGFYAYWAARFAGSPVPRALAQAAVVTTIGWIVIGFKALLHF